MFTAKEGDTLGATKTTHSAREKEPIGEKASASTRFHSTPIELSSRSYGPADAHGKLDTGAPLPGGEPIPEFWGAEKTSLESEFAAVLGAILGNLRLNLSQFLEWLPKHMASLIFRVLILSLLLGSGSDSLAATLIEPGSAWRYFKGTVEPTPNEPAAWRQKSFNDASWTPGVATFFYGEQGLAGTELSDMRGRYTTLYLRRTFTIINPTTIASLQLRSITDDGFIAWINGRRVAATNAPAGDTPANTATAPGAIEPFESEFEINPADLLVPGENILAIQLFNGTLESSDIVFDCELASFDKPSEFPVVVNILPTPGFVSNLTSISVTFSESVTGVTAGDLLINGIPATGLSGSGASYVFTFKQPPFGPLDVSWGPLHKIVDLGNPPLRFDGGIPGSTWAYELVNPSGPNIVEILPTPGLRLRKLAELEVTFSRPVRGITASDLLVNGVPASALLGVGAGPYRFGFSSAKNGPIAVTWNPNHQIVTDDEIPIRFGSREWSYNVDATQPVPDIVINEIMAENQTGIMDEEGDAEDWIELHNRGTVAVNLDGWSLSVDREEEGQWEFPSFNLEPGAYMYLWASGKDRINPVQRLHTNFKLNPNGDTLRLFGPELPRTLVHELQYPEQSPNHAYVRQIVGTNVLWRFQLRGTPGTENTASSITGKVDEVHFSVERGFFNSPFALSLACVTPGAVIRYTTNGSPPTLTNGTTYSTPINISATRIIRAAAFATNQLPSQIRTHTYLQNQPNNRRLLPVLSLVTATNNLYGRQGIMEYSPRNTVYHGPAWERPVSVELIRPEDNGGFQLDAGLRVAGGDYIRGLYNYRSSALPESKYSFRLYFRGDYGPGRLNYRFFEKSTVESFNTLHLRAGMNDHSNPLLKDEFIRALTLETGIPACHGTFVYLFLNGVYKGIYNPSERVDDDFLQAYHGGGELWDVMGPNSAAIRGDAVAWNQLRTAARKDLTVRQNYLDVANRMDLENFVDYLLPLIWADNDDWPHNNTRAAREKVPGSRFRFYPWDAEFAFTAHPVNYDTIATTLSSTSPPWGTTDYQAIFNSLKRTREFQVLFADRVHRAFFNAGPLTDSRIRSVYEPMRAQLAPSINGFNNLISSWISGRRRHVTNSFQKAGFLLSSNAPVASQHGGLVPSGYPLSLSNLQGDIWYTTDGTDPRVPFTDGRHPSALKYSSALILDQAVRLKARSLAGSTNWSALVDVQFDVARVNTPVRFSEIMYNPPGGDAFEYLELENTGNLPLNISGFSLTGVKYRFPDPFPEIAGGGRIVIASMARTNEFKARYPSAIVAGWFDGSLDNSGERLELLNAAGRVVASVSYGDNAFWPKDADGGGGALERSSSNNDPDDPASWISGRLGGTPGATNSPPAPLMIAINELVAGTGSDWVELHNSGTSEVSLSGWSMSDRPDPRLLVFAEGTRIAAKGYLRIICDGNTNAGGLHAPFALDRSGETLALFDRQTNRVDLVRIGPAVDDHSLGRVNGIWRLCEPTPVLPNIPVLLASITNAVLNEVVANPDGGDDWLEIKNLGVRPIALESSYITTANANTRISSPIFVAAGGYIVFQADENPGPDHLNLKFPASGGWISLTDSNGSEVSRMDYGPQSTGVSLGRIPDGTGSFQSLPGSATPGTTNYVAEPGRLLRINEILARSPDGVDWIEFENPSSITNSFSEAILQIDPKGAAPSEWRITSPTPLVPGARIVLSCPQNPAGLPASEWKLPVALPDDGAILSVLDASGRLMDRVEYGPQLVGVSMGFKDGTLVLQTSPTRGLANGPAAILDAGLNLRINEWFASGQGTNEFVELFNGADSPVNLAGWVLTDDPSIRGATNNRFRSPGFVPARGHLRLRTSASQDLQPRQVDFALDALGETLRLIDPAGRIVDSVDFVPQEFDISEGRFPDGNSVIMPFPGSPSPGTKNRRLPMDLDLDGMDDTWEFLNGLNPKSASDALDDADADGTANAGEFLAGTNPRDPSSVLRASIEHSTGDDVVIQFAAQPGKGYQVQSVEGLTNSNWTRVADVSAANFTEPKIIDVRDSISGPSRPTRFYRIVTPIP